MQYIVQKLPAHLFWDSDLAKLDDVEHHEKIIIRTFERGDIDDIALVIAYYGKKICARVLQGAYYLQESAILFGSTFLNIDKKDFESANRIQHHLI